MSKARKKGKKDSSAQRALPTQADLDMVLGLIEAARTRAVAAVNTTLVDLYWSIGEALDRDVKKPHEQPCIGVLLCATKDHEVVEYSLSRAMSPAMVAEYQTRLPDKKLLESKLHEFYELARQQAALAAKE